MTTPKKISTAVVIILVLLALSIGLYDWTSPPLIPSASPALPIPTASVAAVKIAKPDAVVLPSRPVVVAPPKVAPVAASPATAATQALAQPVNLDQTTLKAIINNLRQLGTASQQYMLDKGVTQASYYDLVGESTDDYIRSVDPVVGEDYSGLIVHLTDTEISVSVSDGTVVTFDL